MLYATADGDLASRRGPRRGGSKRADNWEAALHRYEEFARTHGHTPRENTRDRASLPGVERRLGEWARYQRRYADTLTSFQKIRLDVSPAFNWDPLDSVWQARLADCVRHVRDTGRLPYLNGADPAEFALARWLGRQLRQLQTGTLRTDRAVRLTELLSMVVGKTPSP
ncbi:hypothetical protein KIV56_17190 [Cryobacterium breve]|uniref:Helicase-associated domain-containing protein n=1 Tax=Cryobacterium breve TaxID=1259258 RepID=A0ABY7NE56_9MICO|nr:helicase associated domain-containing protein [Cryobacterium breve]WBM79880.1 hypothetical protein KIV56_17190 [Cryobacterium breve]